MKFLLIDDLALKGWKSVIEKAIIKNIGDLEVALNYTEAVNKVSKIKYNLIFLDARLTEDDHLKKETKDLTGFKILKEIRKDFDSPNFSTPIILITASNKIWTVDLFKQNGVDSFYTKEHPNDIISKEASRNNLENLQGNFEFLLKIAQDREDVLIKIRSIITMTKSNINNSNIKLRIEEKLKIGYGLLFRNLSSFESSHFIYSNESLAYVVFWSILEEISKDYFENNWVLSGNDEGSMRDNKWKLRKSGEFFIEDLRYKNSERIDGFLKVAIDWDQFRYVVRKQKIDNHHPNIKFYTGKISLSLQIYAIMLLEKRWEPMLAKELFAPLNDYRNEVDFIHSSISKIFNTTVSNSKNNLKALEKCNDILECISKLLKD